MRYMRDLAAIGKPRQRWGHSTYIGAWGPSKVGKSYAWMTAYKMDKNVFRAGGCDKHCRMDIICCRAPSQPDLVMVDFPGADEGLSSLRALANMSFRLLHAAIIMIPYKHVNTQVTNARPTEHESSGTGSGDQSGTVLK